MLKARKPEIILTMVFLLALIIRLVYLNQIISTPIFHGLSADSEEYEYFARLMLSGNFTPKDILYLNPFYPFFLALVFLIFGHSPLTVVIIQCIIDSISSLLIYFIASKLFNKGVGLTAAFMYACYGIAIFFTGILLAPTVVIFTALLFIISLILAQEKGKGILFLIAGLLFGVMVLARPNSLLFLLFLPLWFFSDLKKKLGLYKSTQGLLILLVGFFMVVSLVITRNYMIEKRFFSSVTAGILFYIGNNPEATGYFMTPHSRSSAIEGMEASIQYAAEEAGKSLTPSQASRYWLLKGLTFLKSNPLDAFSLYCKKFALFWRKEELAFNIDYSLSKTLAPIYQFPLFSFGVIAPFAILGILLALKRKEKSGLIALFSFSYMIAVIIFFICARHRLPIVPFLVIFASYTLYSYKEMIGAREIKKITISSALLILFFIAVNGNFRLFKISTSSTHNSNLGRLYAREGKLDEALIELNKALSIDPNCVEAYSNLGIVYQRRGLTEEAIAAYKKALTINPSYEPALNNLGNAYISQGRWDEAMDEYKKTLSVNPNALLARSNLGKVYIKKGMLDAAITEFKEILVVNPRDEEGHNMLGETYMKKNEFKEGIYHFKQAIDSKPDYVEAYNNLGNAYIKSGDSDKAISAYLQAISTNPRFAQAHYNLGVAYRKKGDLMSAISEFKKALAIKPNYAKAHNQLGIAYYYDKQYTLALEHCNKALELGWRVNPKLLELLKPYS